MRRTSLQHIKTAGFLASHRATYKRLRFVAALCCIAVSTAALAHTGERGFVMLLPTKLYMIAGALAVAVSFIVALLLPQNFFITSHRETNQSDESAPAIWPSALTLALVLILIAAGFTGSRDPLVNPLPTMVWSVWWVGLTVVHALFGNLWAYMNPWRAAFALLQKIGVANSEGLIQYPTKFGYWPACFLFVCFAWFELVYHSPSDPAKLATAMLVFGLINLCAMTLFGAKNWLRFGDPFAVYFRMVSWLSPVSNKNTKDNGNRRFQLPGARLTSLARMTQSGVAFVLLALSVVAFDGFSRTFTWMGFLGLNPLEYPGRSAVLVENTMALLTSFFLFCVVYAIIIFLENRLEKSGRDRSGYFVYSLVPIAFGYYFAHYLPFFLVESQYALRALSDPFTLRWNLFGTANMRVIASLVSNHKTVELIWYTQVAIIVLAHVCAVFVAHTLAVRHAGSASRLFIVELPSTILMIAYTVLGLWLLSTPVVG